MKPSKLQLAALIGGQLAMAVGLADYAMAADAPWNVRVASINIAAPASGDVAGGMTGNSGTTVNLVLSPSQGRIVGFDFSSCKLASFTDDKGTDLMAVESKDRFKKPGINIWSSGDDKTNGAAAQRAEAYVAGIPAKGATSMHIVGKADFYTASQKKQFTVDDLELKAGSKFNLGDFAITVTKAAMGKSMFGGKEMFNVMLSCPQNLESLASLDLYDAQGNSLGAKRSSWGGMFGSYFVEYTLTKEADHAKAVATCWTDWKSCDVPIDVMVGLGL